MVNYHAPAFDVALSGTPRFASHSERVMCSTFLK
jgi:hypothetical protein